MKMYMLLVSVLLLYYQTPTKGSESSEELTDEGSDYEYTLSNSGEGSASARGKNKRTNSNQSKSIKTKKKKYFRYHYMHPHEKDMTAEFEELLKEKELVLKSETAYKWQDLHKKPLKKHKKYWDDFCGKLWPGIPLYIESGFTVNTRKLCVADFFLLDGSSSTTHFKGFAHGYDPDVHKDEWPFTADFLSCDCKYVIPSRLSTRAVYQSRRYFFAMMINNQEYFLLTRVENVDEKSLAQIGYLLKVVDYVNLQETGSVDPNT